LPVLIQGVERHGHLQLVPEVRAALLTVSAATIACGMGIRTLSANNSPAAQLSGVMHKQTGAKSAGYSRRQLTVHC
jgi:hypothetical protein